MMNNMNRRSFVSALAIGSLGLSLLGRASEPKADWPTSIPGYPNMKIFNIEGPPVSQGRKLHGAMRFWTQTYGESNVPFFTMDNNGKVLSRNEHLHGDWNNEGFQRGVRENALVLASVAKHPNGMLLILRAKEFPGQVGLVVFPTTSSISFYEEWI